QAYSTIHDIVGAMRAIAAGRIQGAQRALAASQRYEAIVAQAIAALVSRSASQSASKPAIPLLPELGDRRPLLVVLTSEQPFCGAFNQSVIGLAERRWQELGGPHLLVVGQRGVQQLTRRGIAPDSSETAATSPAGIRDLVKRLAHAIDGRYAAGEIGALHVVYNRYRSVSELVPSEERILPLDLAHIEALASRLGRSASRPAAEYYCYLPIPVLLAGLISEYAFISLFRMAADSYASEQASRLVAMDGATRNAEKMLDSLLDLERRERQSDITRQVLELIGERFATD
ncbi:MAG: F0F1 ATP synthase subunit gamma, partial [Aureliella sp.]